MRLSFSLRWLLIGVAYVAVAAAACVQQSEGWQYALWFANGFAALYALLAVAFWRGRRQAVAAGFVLFAVSYVAVLCWIPAASPTVVVARAFGLDFQDWSRRGEELDERIETLGWELMVAENAASDDYRESVTAQIRAARGRMRFYMSIRALEESLDALSVMLMGIVGGIVGGHIVNVAERDRQAREPDHFADSERS